jgi:multidrug efflux pump
MKLSNSAIDHRITVLVMLAMIVLMGLMSYRSLPRESAPDIKIPHVLISTNYEGASPSDMESLITRPIERKIKDLADVKEFTSTSAEGISSIDVEFFPDVDIDFALQKVRDKVDEATPDLPDDLQDDPFVKEISASDIFPVLYVMVAGDMSPRELKSFAEDLEEELEAVPGVLEVELSGDLEREIRVEFDEKRLAAYGLTLLEIFNTVTRNNVDTPGGTIEVGEANYSLKVPGEFDDPAIINKLVVAVRNGQPVYLTDLASVRDTYKDRTSFSRVNGKEAIALRVTKRQGENVLKIATNIKNIVQKWEEDFPSTLTFTITSDSSSEVNTMVLDLENNLLTGLILVLVVVFCALGFRNALLVSIAIPLSMLISFTIIELLGMTLNMVVLFSLILALGMLVDNGIVLVENIYRHHVEENLPILEAAKAGTAEVAWPVISSTTTTVAAFFPLVFWPGIMGQFMSYLPKTVIIALVSSLFVALIITPPLCVIIMKKMKIGAKPIKKTSERGIIILYEKLLRFFLGYRVLSISFFVLLLIMAIRSFSLSGLGIEMFPDTEPSRLAVEIKAPEGTTVEKSNQFAYVSEKIIERYGNIKYVTTSVGTADGENQTRITIDLVDRELRLSSQEKPAEDNRLYFNNSNDTMEAIRQEITTAIIGAEVKVDKEENGPPVGAPINIEIEGEDFPTLAAIAEQIKQEAKTIPGIVDLRDNYEDSLPEVEIEVDRERAALLGLDTTVIGQMVKTAFNGWKVADYREGKDEYDITVRLPLEQRKSLGDIMTLHIPDAQGNPIPLSSVATLVYKSGLSTINHIDQKRVITVSSNVATGYNAPALLGEIQRKIKGLKIPNGYKVSYTGENEEMEEAQTFLTKAFLIAILSIALVLVTQFNSILQPFMILTCVIMSLIGVFLGLMINNQPFGVMMTGMGVISLAGIVVNNAIVLIDYINQLRQKGLSCSEAIIQAGTTRFRPVMLTAITTVLGLLPMALGISFDFHTFEFQFGAEMAQYWGPMAIAVIYGLTIATTLTLFLIPSIYSLVYDWGYFRKTRLATADTDQPKVAQASSL